MPHEGALTRLASLATLMQQQSEQIAEQTEQIALLAQMQRDAMGAQRLPGSGTYAFRRTSSILRVPVALQPTEFLVPDGFFGPAGSGKDATSFSVFNPNPCCVQLRGSPGATTLPPTDADGWIPFPPLFWGTFSTQFPTRMSARIVPYAWLPTPSEPAPLWLTYGGGV